VVGVRFIAVRTLLTSVILDYVSVIVLTAVLLDVTLLATFVTLFGSSWNAILGVYLHCITVVFAIISSFTTLTTLTTTHFESARKRRPLSRFVRIGKEMWICPADAEKGKRQMRKERSWTRYDVDGSGEDRKWKEEMY
jgi:hypothetical protein